MNPMHIAIAVFNLLCGLLALGGALAHVPSPLIYGVFFGYWAHALALAVALWVLALIAVRSFSGKALITLAHNWLALANVAVIVAVWSAVVLVDRMIVSNS
jgi:hypothetical protein